MSTTAVGRAAEAAAATFLQNKGFTTLAQNWRTRWCEIDIVASHNATIYFVEVKYRASNTWGDGLDYITQRKLQQMRFAASFWMASHAKASVDYQLAAIALHGTPPVVQNWLDAID